MSSCRILIVEDNPHLRTLLNWQLLQAGYCSQVAGTLAEARDLIAQVQPELVVLDLQLPDGDGIDFCQWLRTTAQAYILILSFRGSEAERVRGLKAGADDYLAKPFGMQEFLARIEALTRRVRVQTPSSLLQFGVLHIDPVQRRVILREQTIDLTPQEFSLLYVLARQPGVPLSREELLRQAWPDGIDNPRTVDTHILTLRKKIESEPRSPRYIQTVRSVGYQFQIEELG